MDIREQLDEMMLRMMLLENEKVVYDNIRFYNTKQDQPFYERVILEKDQESYKLGLEFSELKSNSELSLGELVHYTEITFAYANNLLHRYHIFWPGCQKFCGSQMSYASEEELATDKEEIIAKIKTLLEEGKIDTFMKKRLLLATEYLYNHDIFFIRKYGNPQNSKERIRTNRN